MNPPYRARSARRRSKRSIQKAATNPLAAAANVYADTMNPNSCGPIAKSRMNCGPSGIMIMKSTTCVNWTAASVRKSGSPRGARGAAGEDGERDKESTERRQERKAQEEPRGSRRRHGSHDN